MVVVLIIGLRSHEIKIRHAVISVGHSRNFSFRHFGWHFGAYVVVLVFINIALILKIFKGDTKIR